MVGEVLQLDVESVGIKKGIVAVLDRLSDPFLGGIVILVFWSRFHV